MLQPVLCEKETYAYGGNGSFYLGRIEHLLPALLEAYQAQVQLIYLDPPFGTGERFTMQMANRQMQRVAYEDVLSEQAYMAMMRTALEGAYQLLAQSGSIYLHVDYRMAAKLKLLLDSIFGEENFVNEIIWMYKSGGRSTKHFSRKHDTILFYRKSKKQYFDITAVGTPRGPERRNHMKRFIDKDGRVCYSIRSGGKVYVYHEDSLVFPSDVWTDIEHLHQRDPERNGYATQKPEALLQRILFASSRPGDLVMDFFSGSGTTAAVASKTGRRYVVCDSSPFALYAFRRRQCKLHNSFTFFDEPLPMTLYFPAAVQADVCPQVERLHENHYLTGYGSCAATLLYCATGFIDGGAFTPVKYTYMPALPLLLPTPKEAPVLHLIDNHGTQGFWRFENN